ncbi:hypothetical protein ACLMJK_005844 [Lecanora helva]
MAPLGNLVRLLPLHIAELPFHPALEALIHAEEISKISADERPNLFSFVKEVLDEATRFVEDTLPNTFKEGSLKSSSPSKGQVRLWSRDIQSTEIQSVPWTNAVIPRNQSAKAKKPAETWFARSSRHANSKTEGTADFDEFDWGLRVNHSKHEQEYTPDVFDSYKVLDWSDQIREAIDIGTPIENYRDINMSIFEMCHALPAMLSNRIFSVVVVTAKAGDQSFITVQIPVDISNLTAAFYSNGRNLKEGDSSLKRKKPVVGVYTSIERGQLTNDEETEWVMATASDAKGYLPMGMQKLGVPSAVVKDVGLFMRYIQNTRSSTK